MLNRMPTKFNADPNTHREAYCEMKIKEKGLTGKAADLRKQNFGGSGRKGFNAFREMAELAKGGSGQGGKDKDNSNSNNKGKGKPEVYLEFLGTRIRVHEEDGGSVKPEDVPAVRGAALRFEGAGEDVSFDEIKVRARSCRWLLVAGFFLLALLYGE